MQRFESLSQISAKVAFSPACNLACVYCRGSSNREDFPTTAAMEDFRASEISTGVISTDQLLKVLSGIYEAGVNSIRPTGGEPMLRHDWDIVVNEAYKIGYRGIDITTNGILLTRYLEENGGLPQGLSTVKVSLDTADPDEFRRITGGGDLNKVIDGVRAITGLVYVRANTVLTRSGMSPLKIAELVAFQEN